MTTRNLILACDPSLSCTGWAVLRDDGTEHGQIVEAGFLSADDKDGEPFARAGEIAADLSTVICRTYLHVTEGRLIGPRTQSPFALMIIETPRDNGAGMRGQRSAGSLPGYGIAVGRIGHVLHQAATEHGADFRHVSASEWTRGMPGNAGDKHKQNRVTMVGYYWPAWRDRLGPKSKASNAADALLLARWGMLERRRREEARRAR